MTFVALLKTFKFHCFSSNGTGPNILVEIGSEERLNNDTDEWLNLNRQLCLDTNLASLITIALTICPRLNFELDPTETIDALMSCPI